MIFPNSSRFRAVFFVLPIVFASSALAQIPLISQNGVVNGASWASPVAPGGLFSIFGTNLAASAQSAGAPLPLTLGGTSVTVGGIPAPLSYVSPGQINAQVPASISAPLSSIVGTPVVVTTAAGSSGAAQMALAASAPGFFTADQSGCGEAAALNIRPDGTVSINSPTNSAAPGDYIALYGTGFGVAAQQPADGTAASGAAPARTPPWVYLDNKPVAVLEYAGLAPSLVGVDQVNFQIPASTRNGCAVPLSASGGLLDAPPVTISVQAGGGQCTDPPIQSWGQITFSRTILAGAGTPVALNPDFFGASFPAGPGLQPPAPTQAIVFAPDYVSNVFPGGPVLVAANVFLNAKSCAVPGYSNLSAGSIQIQPPSSSAVAVKPTPLDSGGVIYGQPLPNGFIGPGTYAISGTPGSPVGLAANLTVGSPIQLQTALPAGTAIPESQPFTLRWTGGDSTSVVRLSLTSGSGAGATSLYTYAPASAGSLTINPVCDGNGVNCGFGLPPSAHAQVTVQVLPNPGSIVGIAVPGVTGPVQLSWDYSYVFFGLSLVSGLITGN